ncbi:MAG: fibronectin type III domain-containing protein, partial [FCB group bacterium]|nr:fibronectin type III domain-containing protein [FCB group bacterium]
MDNNCSGNLKKEEYHAGVISHFRQTLKFVLLFLLFSLPLFAQIPSVPQNLTATPGNSKVTLKWNKVDYATLAKYNIYRGNTTWNINLLDSVMATASAPPDTFYVDNNVQNDTTYYYYITAVD